MSSSTALLPKNKMAEHPIFLRVCHPPWVCIRQSTLVLIRGLFAFYMTAVFVMLVYYKERHAINPWTIPFEFSVIIYLLQLIYGWITFVSLVSILYYHMWSFFWSWMGNIQIPNHSRQQMLLNSTTGKLTFFGLSVQPSSFQLLFENKNHLCRQLLTLFILVVGLHASTLSTSWK